MGDKDRITYHKINDVVSRLERGVLNLKNLFNAAPEVHIDVFLESEIGGWQEYADGIIGRVLSKLRAIVVETHFKEGAILPDHWHAVDEYITVVSGSLFEHRSQEKYKFGETYLIKKGTPHKFEALEDCELIVEFDCFI